MSEIIKMPYVPRLNTKGQPNRPMVTLLGGRMGSWQIAAAKRMVKQARVVVQTNTPTAPAGSLHPMDANLAVLTYLEQSDLVLIWCGKGEDALYLDEWIWASWLVAAHPDRVVCGIESGVDHPMAPTLAFVLQQRRIVHYQAIDDAVSMAQERCREIRGTYHG